MSGGVDSSVAAYLLKEQGYDVIGVMLKLAPDDPDYEENNGGCCSLSASEDARMVAEQLDIPFYMINMKKPFYDDVIVNFFDEYFEGRTPNPCIQCNKHIKFDKLLQKARELGAEYIATGHYAKVVNEEGRYRLQKGEDPQKDQTYMLYNFTQDQLAHTLMPCGEYNKDEIRKIGESIGLHLFRKKDSQEICFVPDNNHGNFIIKHHPGNVVPGNFVDGEGNILGKHKGIVHYTIGQRRGLGLSLKSPGYVIEIRPNTNEVVIGSHDELFKDTVIAKDVNLIHVEKVLEPVRVMGKVRYSQNMYAATVYPMDDNKIKIVFDEKQRAITKGQSVVLYLDDYVFGGGIIDEVN